ncbi:unnamed protein product [Spirodela intermedia]|uniref:Uncharacterized protein n=1 Tax=Spirodela intermedia TaxID=51605 RepID=A0A7I8KDE8_SPIIN|nr:unnamed protein product [Spirodela intermedia]
MERTGGGGAESELLRIGGRVGPAELAVVCGDANAAVARVDGGDFSLVAVTREGTPLCLLACSVGDHRWLLARDSPVIRVGPRKFSFAFPGFFYGLSLPDGSFDRDVDRFELVLERFCTYQNHAGRRDAEFSPRRRDTDFWASAYAKIDLLSSSALPPRGYSSPPAAALSIQSAHRASSATKLVAQALKAIANPSHHIHISGDISGGATFVFPTLRVVSDVAHVLQAAAGDLSGGAMTPLRRCSPLPGGGGAACWHFNLAGLLLILRTVSAVAVGAAAAGVAPECSTSSGAGGGRE